MVGTGGRGSYCEYYYVTVRLHEKLNLKKAATAGAKIAAGSAVEAPKNLRSRIKKREKIHIDQRSYMRLRVLYRLSHLHYFHL